VHFTALLYPEAMSFCELRVAVFRLFFSVAVYNADSSLRWKDDTGYQVHTA